MKRALLKIPSAVYDFIYNMNFQWKYMLGMGEKTPKTKRTKPRKKGFSPFGCPPIPPSIELEADCFPGRKNRKQVGPALGGTGVLIYRGEKK